MFQLIQVLLSFRHKALALWTLTVAEWDFPSCSESSTWTVLRESRGFRHLVLAARGVMYEGGYADLLRVRYEKAPKAVPADSPVIPLDALLLHQFTAEEIRRFAAQVFDPCPAHQAGTVVPPLLLLKTLLEQQSIHSGQIRFLAPIPVETPILLHRTNGGMAGYAEGRTIFTLSVN